MIPPEQVFTSREQAGNEESQQKLRIVQTRIESQEGSAVGREMTETIRRTIKPSLYDRLRREMRID